MIAFVRDADMQRAAMLQNVELEHTNKLASIGRLAAGVAHEINNPLAIINQKAGLMEDLMMISDEFPHKNELSELIGAIHNAVKRCSTVTHRLLGFARHMDTTIETVDLNKVITDVSSFLEKEAEHRKVKVGLHLFEKPALIESDRGQLEQVFLNIINNAFEAVDDGGKINISVEEKWEVTRHEDVMKFYSEAFEVTVSDNGKGIMEKHLKHIFEPFFTTKDHYSTGLGLSLTYGIVKKLGGTIHVHSHFGKGSTFVVTLYKKRKIVIAQPTPM
jgi:signal transduction histidine kinase